MLSVAIHRLPPHLPLGSYKLVVRILYKSDFGSQADLYYRIIDKPIDWKKLPLVKRPHQRTH